MTNWKPKIDDDFDKASNQELKKRRYILAYILIGAFLLAAIVGKSPYFEIILSLAILLSLGLYIKWRKIFVSTYTKDYVESTDKNIVNRYFQKFYLDYSWKDSLIMFLILVVGILIIGVAIFFLHNSKII